MSRHLIIDYKDYNIYKGAELDKTGIKLYHTGCYPIPRTYEKLYSKGETYLFFGLKKPNFPTITFSYPT